MNALRRILLAFYSVLLLAATGGVIALAWNQDKKLDLEAGAFNLEAFIVASDNAKWAATGILAAIGLFAFVTLVIAFVRAGQGSKGTLRIKQSDGGTVEVSAGNIETLLREELESLPEVRRVVPHVRVNSGAVDTTLDATIESSASIAHATSVLGEGVAAVLREQVGVTSVRRPTIRISYDEMAARPVGAARRQEPLESRYRAPATVAGPATATAAGVSTAAPDRPPAETDERADD
jgi:hypothetical protein